MLPKGWRRNRERRGGGRSRGAAKRCRWRFCLEISALPMKERLRWERKMGFFGVLLSLVLIGSLRRWRRLFCDGGNEQSSESEIKIQVEVKIRF